MASMTELGDERFDMAIDFLQQFPNLFPRKLKTKTEVINGEVFFDEFKTISELKLPEPKTKQQEEVDELVPSDFGLSIDDPSA